jgi:hypothetical protein
MSGVEVVKASELIKRLEELIKEHGDQKVTIEEAGSAWNVSTIEVVEFTPTWTEFCLH